jgi:hypothetical protein
MYGSFVDMIDIRFYSKNVGNFSPASYISKRIAMSKCKERYPRRPTVKRMGFEAGSMSHNFSNLKFGDLPYLETPCCAFDRSFSSLAHVHFVRSWSSMVNRHVLSAVQGTR